MAREHPGLIGDVASIASNGLRAIRTRLELLTIELKEEKAWVVRFIVSRSARPSLWSMLHSGRPVNTINPSDFV